MIKIDEFKSYPVEQVLGVRYGGGMFIIETDCNITPELPAVDFEAGSRAISAATMAMIKRQSSHDIVFNNIVSVTVMGCGTLKLVVDRWVSNEHKEVYSMFDEAMNRIRTLEIELPEKLVVIRVAGINAFSAWKASRRLARYH